jgi:putative DNA primase/helicase
MPKDTTLVVEIAIGASRFESKWKNGKMAWPSLVDKLSKPHRTHETFAYYETAKKQVKDKIKDIGGFVGGYLTGGIRKSSALAYRTVLTLDADEATPRFWATFKLLYGHAAVVYSTHSHSPEKPRYRLVMPLNRQCTSEEYQPLARRVAGDLGIEQFDNTGFQDERLMYWPSCSSDGVYEFYHQDGPALDVDEVLESYTDWRDVSEWPVSERVTELIKHAQKKQGDPLEKKGIVGAFCRTYGIEEAIEKYLEDVYEKTDKENRYTYTGGSTAAGLYVYDDKFAFSHHNTDPISGKLCNAFDLVRLHLYGDEDKGIDTDTPICKRPSYISMRELVTKDKDVRRQIGSEKLEAAREDFKELGFGFDPGTDPVDIGGVDETWLENLEVDKQGEYSKTIDNVVMILENDPIIKDAVALDAFAYRAVVKRKLPWRKSDTQNTDWSDNDTANLRWYIEKVYGITGGNKIQDAIDVILARHTFHPVREYLNALQWDGTERVEELLIRYFDADDTVYTREVIKRALISAVARVYRPGCKADCMLVLKGPQGFKKSTFIDILGGPWYSDTLTSVQGKDAYEQIQGSWIVEVAELASMSKAEVEQVKHFISKRKDKFRPAYGRMTAEYFRQGVFMGTTNKDSPLRDISGGRRFWPVECKCKIKNEEELRRLRDQIWAEVVSLFEAGAIWWLEGEVEKIAEKIQYDHTETDDRVTMVEEYLDKLLPANWDNMTIWDKREFLNGDELQPVGEIERTHVTALDIYMELFGGAAKDYSLRTAREINDMMKRFEKEWEYKPFKRNGKVTKGFVKRRTYYQKLMEKKFLG